MTTYYKYGVKLNQNQKDKLMKAYKKNCPITIRLVHSSLQGNDKLILTKRQVEKIRKAY